MWTLEKVEISGHIFLYFGTIKACQGVELHHCMLLTGLPQIVGYKGAEQVIFYTTKSFDPSHLNLKFQQTVYQAHI